MLTYQGSSDQTMDKIQSVANIAIWTDPMLYSHALGLLYCNAGNQLPRQRISHYRRMLLRSCICSVHSVRYLTIHYPDDNPAVHVAVWSTSKVPGNALRLHQIQDTGC